MIRAVDRLLAEAEGPAPELLSPRGAQRHLGTVAIDQRRPGLLPWIPWEQLELPLRARGRLTVNLCNLGPLASRNAVTMIHDAQVYLTPGSYTPAFRLWYRACLPALGRRSRLVLTVSNYSRDQLVRFRLAPAERITVIHNGADHILRPAGDPRALGRFGLPVRAFACAQASTQDHKNIGLLLRAFADPALRKTTLVLIGAATAADFRARGHVIPPNVVFTGRITDAELRGLLEDALCYLCPSLTEGFGLPPLEAMLLGTPAIVAPEGALPEICDAAALYADARDPAAWVARIQDLARLPALWQSRSRAGRARAATFTWRRAATALLATLAGIAP
jgi:glycosyltransferase involved in cell wall biosynthesis